MSAEPPARDWAAIGAAFGQSVEAMQPAILNVSITLRDTLTPALRHASRSMHRLAFVIRLAKMRANDTRPNGKPRRSGHRHRGTAAWDRRSGVR